MKASKKLLNFRPATKAPTIKKRSDKTIEKRPSKMIEIRPHVISQMDLAEYEILEGDLMEARERLDAKRLAISSAILRGAIVESGPLRAFLKRSEKVHANGHTIKTKLVVR